MKRFSQVRPGGQTAYPAVGYALLRLFLLFLLPSGCSVDVAKLRAGGPISHDSGIAIDAGVDSEAVVYDLAPVRDLLSPADEVAPSEVGAGRDALPRDAIGDVPDTTDAPDSGGSPDLSDSPVDTLSDVDIADGTDSDGGEADPDGGTDGAPVADTADATDTANAVDAAVDSAAPNLEADLVLWYPFDEASGTTAANAASVGGASRDASLITSLYATYGTATFTTACKVGTHALKLSPSAYTYGTISGYVTLPAPFSIAPNAVTISFWIRLASATASANWARIFDFGNGSTAPAYLYLTARAADSTPPPLRFGISNTGHTDADEQRLESKSALSAGVWHHVAIVLPMPAPGSATYTGILYLDGEEEDSNPAMTLHLSDIGATTMNWLGRSPFTADPTLNGSLDDFRMYQRALSHAEIALLNQGH